MKGVMERGKKKWNRLAGTAVAVDGKTEGEAPDKAESVRQVTITLLGQVKAGKSSLVNSLIGTRSIDIVSVRTASSDFGVNEIRPHSKIIA